MSNNEAVAYLYGRRCGHCLKKTSELYNLEEVYREVYQDKSLDTEDVCKDCFEELCRKYNVAFDEDVLEKCRVDLSRYDYWSSWTDDSIDDD